MSDRLKMILKIIALFGVAGLIGLGMYFLFFRATPQVATPPTTTGTTPGGLSSGASGGPVIGGTTGTTPTGTGTLPPSPVASGGTTATVQLTSAPITAPTLTSGNKIAYYNPTDGKFYTIDANGNVVALSSKSFAKASSVVFANDASKAAIEFPDGSNVIYNFTTQEQITLPTHWQDFAFSTDSSALVSKSIGTDVNSRALVLSSADGSRTQVVVALGDNADKVTPSFSPNDAIVAFSDTGTSQTGFGRHEIYLLDKNGNAVSGLIVDGPNFSAIWAPSGTAVLYSNADPSNENRATLWYTLATGTSAGGNRRDLGVETWVQKCTWSDETTVYCAVPRTGASSSGIDSRLVTSDDDIYSINITTGKKTLVGSPSTNMQIFHLKLSDDHSLLYFTDSAGRLNYIRLK